MRGRSFFIYTNIYISLNAKKLKFVLSKFSSYGILCW
nr:MAG TPA: hypothetical protein [Caudoviricetes sp.]